MNVNCDVVNYRNRFPAIRTRFKTPSVECRDNRFFCAARSGLEESHAPKLATFGYDHLNEHERHSNSLLRAVFEIDLLLSNDYWRHDFTANPHRLGRRS